MSKPGAKKLDQIVSVTPGDVHIIMIPSPGGPIPTPIPHPCASMIKDKVAKKVKVMGQPGATKGSKSKHTPPHIPMGGPFQKPPGNKGEVMTGAAGVKYQGKDATLLGETGKMCADPSDTPVGKVIGTAALVLVGGGSGSGDADRAKASADAMKAAAAKAHKWIDANMPEGAARDQAHKDVCTQTGHPVDVVTGRMFIDVLDVRLPGRFPLLFERTYSSLYRESGAFGTSWRHVFERELFVHHDFVVYRDEQGSFHAFSPVETDGTSWSEPAKRRLERGDEEYRIVSSDGSREYYERVEAARGGAQLWRLRRIEDAQGNALRMGYGAEGRLISVRDATNRMLRLDHDDRGRVLALRLESGALQRRLWSFEYNDQGELVMATDGAGHSRRYQYDGGFLVREEDRKGDWFCFEYDSDGRCVRTWGQNEAFFRQLDYDPVGQRTRVTDSGGFVTVYEYDPRGVVTEASNADGHAWTFDYNDSLDLVRECDPLGSVWTKEYDDQGLLVAIEDGEGASESYEWDQRGRMISCADRAGGVWQYEFEDEARRRVTRDPLGQETVELFDEQGEVISVVQPDGSQSRFEYDLCGNLVRIEAADGLVIDRSFNAFGELIREADQYGPRVEVTYDELGRYAGIEYRGRRTTRYERDAEGRVVRMSDGSGRSTEFSYLPFVDKITEIIERGVEGRVLARRSFSYDSEHRLSSATFGSARVAEFEYSHHRHPVRMTFADGRALEYRYDEREHLVELRENGELVYRQEADSRGRVVRRRTGDGDEFEFEYDELGRLVRAEGGANGENVELERDALGRLVSESGGVGAHHFQYAAGGRQVDYAWNDDLALQHEWHPRSAGRSWATSRDGRLDLRLDYDARHRLERIETARGDRQEWAYGSARGPERLEVFRPGRSGEQFRFRYDDQDLLAGIDAESSSVSYRRDELDRLVEMSVEGSDEAQRFQWAFDDESNRVQATDWRGESYECEFAPGGRPTRVGSRHLEYDPRGRVERIREEDGRTTELEWNALNQLTKVRKSDGQEIAMTYDPLGRRVSKRTSTGTTRFAWLDSRLSHSIAPDGDEQHYIYQFGTYRPLATYARNDGAEWGLEVFLNAPNGSPLEVWTPSGDAHDESSPMPWGERDSESTEEQPFGLQGQYYDAEIGLYYNNARYYLAEGATYLSPDPLGLAGADSTYAFVADPLSWMDPLGLAFQRAFGRDEVSQTLDDSEGRPSPTTGYDGHPRSQHVGKTPRQLQDRADAPGQPNTVTTFGSSSSQDRAATDALNSPQGQAALAELDADPTKKRVRIRATTGPETIRQARNGQGYQTRFTSRETVVIVDVVDRTPGAEKIHIQTCYGS